MNEKPGIQPKELCAHMQLTPSTVTRLIEKLERKGLVERKSVGRCTEVFSTEQGRKLEPEIKTAWKHLYQRYSGQLGETASQKLTTEIFEATNKLDI